MLHHLKRATDRLLAERSSTPELISYMTIRKAVGWLGISLPLVLPLGSLAFSEGCVLQPSISHYYFTNMREIFVGVLCAVSLFLFTYKGHSRMDSLASNLAGFMALGVALFPTNSIAGFPCQHNLVSLLTIPYHDAIHETCAGFFFVILALMSLLLFTKSKKHKTMLGTQKRKRNAVYKICGWIMLASITVIIISKPLLKVSADAPIIYWMETTALLAFGISWLTKGEAVLADRPEEQNV